MGFEFGATERIRFAYKFQVVIAMGFHLFPFRTEKLSPFTPMVLHLVVGE